MQHDEQDSPKLQIDQQIPDRDGPLAPRPYPDGKKKKAEIVEYKLPVDAEVYVKNVDNWKDWIKQKIRTSKAHETLDKYVDIKTTPRVKNFKNEAKGTGWLVRYPSSFTEVVWTSPMSPVMVALALPCFMFMAVVVLSWRSLQEIGWSSVGSK